MIVERSQIGRVGRGAILSVLIPVICLCFWASVVAAAGNPLAVVQTGTNQVIHLLKEYPPNSPSLTHKVRAVVDDYFDFHAIAKNALGPEWKRQPPAKREQFAQDFSKLLFHTYIGRIEGYTDQTITYDLIEQGADIGVVRAEVTGAQNMARTSIVYYLKLNNGNWKVYDVVINGMGLVTNYRDQFDSILARSSFDDLLRQLEAKAAQS